MAHDVHTIAGLLAKAESVAAMGHEAEAKALTGKAAELMAKTGITQAMVEAAKPKEQRRTPGRRTWIMERPFQHQRKDLLTQIGDALGLKPVIHRDPTPGTGYRHQVSVELFGADDDLDGAYVLYTSTLLQALNLLKAERVNGSSAKQSWLQGWAAGIGVIVREQKRRVVTAYDQEFKLASGNAALVLADWDDQVDRFRASIYPNLGRVRARSTSGNQFRHGYVAGLRADIGGSGRVGPGTGQRAIA